MSDKLRELATKMGDFIGTMLDEEWEWTHTRRGSPPSICVAGGCTWSGSDDHEPGCPIVRIREVLRLSRIALTDNATEEAKIDEEIARKVWHEVWDTGDAPIDIRMAEEEFDTYWVALRAALATQKKGEG